MVYAADWGGNSGEPAFTELLKQFPEMDGLFVGNDWLSMGVLRTAQRRGLRIPEDLAVVGFDNQPVSAHFYPSLTTVDQDKQKLGLQAIDLLIEKIEAHFSGQPVSNAPMPPLQHQLVIRESAP